MSVAAPRAHVVSSFTIVKGTQLDATYRAFERWDLGQPRRANLDRLKASDAFGRASASWRVDLAKTINRRFDTDGRDRVLVELAQAGCPLATWKPLVLWHMTRDEFLVRDFLAHWLYDRYAAGTWRVRKDEVAEYLRGLPERSEVAVKETWSERTTDRVASGLLRLAADFDLLVGTTARAFASYHLPEEALLYLLHAAAELQPNAHALVQLDDWHMYLLGSSELQQELLRLHQFGRLRYEVAGSIASLELPHPTAAAFARAELMP